MGRALLTISFIVVLLWWLQWEFKQKVDLKKYWGWIAGALFIQALSGIAFAVIDGVKGNFIYHAVGGGMMTALLFVYLLKTYNIQISWRLELVLLYAFVSALGVINELAEYMAEFFIGVGTLSWDSHDTWRDLVANTSGAILAWGIYRLSLLWSRKSKSKH